MGNHLEYNERICVMKFDVEIMNQLYNVNMHES